MKDFFISYTGKNKDWATWLAWQLEDAGYSTIIQAWDFRPGGNFVIEMQTALLQSERTIAVLSEEYLQSAYATPEWAAVFAKDPMGTKNKLIPVKIAECKPEGLLTTLIWIDLTGLSELDARNALMNGIQVERAKPQHPPMFPGQHTTPEKPAYPQTVSKQEPYIPIIKKAKTDLDISNFIDESFKTIRQYFTDTGAGLMNHYPEVVVKINHISDTKFLAETFKNGKSEAACQIWIDYSHRPQIGYYEGQSSWHSNTSYNEILSISDNQQAYGLQSLMRFGWEHKLAPMDFNHLSPTNAADYLWRRFISALER